MNDFIIIFYSSPSHDGYARWCNAYCEHYNILHRWYTLDWLKKTDFYAPNKELLSQPRGGGYWIWKAYIIKDALLNNPGKSVLYLDASIIWPIDPSSYIAKMEAPWIIRTEFNHSDWCKRDTFVRMECDKEKFWKAKQVWAGCVHVSIEWLWLVEEWQKYMLIPGLVDDSPNVCGLPNFPGFMDHRHDQAILTNLLLKHDIIARDPIMVNNDSLFQDKTPTSDLPTF